MTAAVEDRAEIVELLIDRGATIKPVSWCDHACSAHMHAVDLSQESAGGKGIGEPVLHVASFKGSSNAVQVLLERGADQDLINEVKCNRQI